jgi:hypothetical protein
VYLWEVTAQETKRGGELCMTHAYTEKKTKREREK